MKGLNVSLVKNRFEREVESEFSVLLREIRGAGGERTRKRACFAGIFIGKSVSNGSLVAFAVEEDDGKS